MPKALLLENIHPDAAQSLRALEIVSHAGNVENPVPPSEISTEPSALTRSTTPPLTACAWFTRLSQAFLSVSFQG